MTVLEKYESIDQRKLSKDLSIILVAMKRKSKNFTSEKDNEVFEPKLDKIIATLKRKYPEAIKGGVNKIPTKTPKNKIEEALDSIESIVDKDPILKGFKGSDIQRDATRKAKPAGKRISKDGNIYYENRENRSDRLAPNFPKNRPFLEKGGKIERFKISDNPTPEELYDFIEYKLNNIDKNTLKTNNSLKGTKNGYEYELSKNKKSGEWSLESLVKIEKTLDSYNRPITTPIKNFSKKPFSIKEKHPVSKHEKGGNLPTIKTEKHRLDKPSVKNINYKTGQKVYYSEGATPENYRGKIVENLKISVVIKKPNGEKQTINKRNLGIVI